MNKATFTVTGNVRARVPEVLVNHIWKLALACEQDEKQLFFLRTSYLFEEPVQEILHGRVGHAPQRYRVFGFEPVTCSVCVCRTGAGAAMFLEGEDSAAA